MEIQFTPLYVNPPKPGKKWGSIKSASGERYMIPGGSEDMFTKDQPVNIRWEKAAWTDTGLVQAVNGVQLGDPQVANGSTPAAPPIPAPPNPPVPAVAAPQSAQPAQGPIINGRYTDQQRAEDIFVTGIVGRVLGGSSGNFGIMDIATIAKAAVQAWAGRHSVARPTAEPDAPDAPLNPPADPRDGQWQNLG